VRYWGRYQPPRDRQAPLAAIIVLAVVLVGAGIAGGIAAVVFSSAPVLVGTLVPGQPLAPSWKLTDNHGKEISLSTLRGQVVVLTFVWPNCSSSCLATLRLMSDADVRLGLTVGKVVWLGVNVGVTREPVQEILNQREFSVFALPGWHYLTGSASALRAVWSYYFVGTDAVRRFHLGEVSRAPTWLSPSRTEVYLIDPQGRERVVLGSDLTAPGLARDIRILAGASA
jgi:cytochrome oxidase Cu insertion factor (SCO1/SenC/PrrC family)